MNEVKTKEIVFWGALFITALLIPLYFFRFSVFGIPTNIFEIAVLFLLVIFGAAFWQKKSQITLGPIWPYLLLIVVLRGAFFSGSMVNALGILKGWFLVPMFLYLVTINLYDQKQIVSLLRGLTLGIEVISIWAILQRFGLVALSFYQKNDPTSFAGYLSGQVRAFGPFESPNYLAMFLVPGIFLSLPAMFAVKDRAWKFLLLSLPILALLFTSSRGGIAAMAVSAFVVGSWKLFGDRKIRFRLSKSLIVAMVLIVVLIINAVAVWQVTEYAQSGGDRIRGDIYAYSLQMVKQHPITGIGLGQFPGAIDRLSLADGAFREFGLSYALHPHNLFLAFWLNLGLIGLILFVIVLYQAFIQAITQKSILGIASLGALLAILLHGTFDTTYFKNDLSALFWLACACAYLSQRTHEKIIS